MQGQKDREWRQILSMHSRTGVSVARCTLHMLINNMFYPPGCLGFAWVSAKTKNVGNLGAVAAPKAPKGLLWLGDKLCLFLHFVSSFQVIWTDRRVGPKKKRKRGSFYSAFDPSEEGTQSPNLITLWTHFSLSHWWHLGDGIMWHPEMFSLLCQTTGEPSVSTHGRQQTLLYFWSICLKCHTKSTWCLVTCVGNTYQQILI